MISDESITMRYLNKAVKNGKIKFDREFPHTKKLLDSEMCRSILRKPVALFACTKL